MANDLNLFKTVWSKVFLPAGRAIAIAFTSAFDGLCLAFSSWRYPRSTFAKACGKPFRSVRKDKGALGEYLLFDALRRIKGEWLFNLYLPIGEEYTEIDSLLICRRGIFIFESKNFSGRVYGLSSQTEWTQTRKTKRGIRKQKFFNPLMQNAAHEKALSAVVGRQSFHPIVVFGKKCELYTPTADERPREITTLRRLKRLVRSFIETGPDKTEASRLRSVLLPYTQATERQKAEHIRFVAKRNQ